MSDDFQLVAPESFWAAVKKLVKNFKDSPRGAAPVVPEPLPDDCPPPIRFITLEPYTTYIIKTYPAEGYASYDLDGDDRSGQEYVVMVDGETPVPVALMHYEWAGNHKQMISFKGDTIGGKIKLALGDYETTELDVDTITAAELQTALEALPQIGTDDLVITMYPGRWLIEFAGKLTGQAFDLFEVDRPDDAVFEIHVYETRWNDSGRQENVLYPIPLIGEYDVDDDGINDAVAAGSFGTADWFPGAGWIVNVNECRDFNGDGTPDI